VARVVTTNDVRDRFTSFGIETLGTSPGQFKQFFIADLDKWSDVIKASGIQIE
jgi:tripartite-type tricarboxylate transporter receptor subunit TctC